MLIILSLLLLILCVLQMEPINGSAELLNESELLNHFTESELMRAKHLNPGEYKFFLKFVTRFDMLGQSKEYLNMMLNSLRGSDSYILSKIREILGINYFSPNDIIRKHDKDYIKAVNNKVYNIKRFVTNASSVLDVGTEDLRYLKKLDKEYKCNSMGLNLNDNSVFAHYGEGWNELKESGKLTLYDGVNMPFPDNSYELITAISIIHHVPDFSRLAGELYRVCSKHLVIKDVNLISDDKIIFFKFQHYLYDGVLKPAEFTSYMNLDTTYQKTIGALLAVGFKLANVDRRSDFVGSYWAHLIKGE